MAQQSQNRSDNNTPEYEVNILNLAIEFNIPVNLLRDTLKWSAHVQHGIRENGVVKAAGKAPLQELIDHASSAVNLISDESVQARIFSAVGERAQSPDDPESAYYAAYCAARNRIDHSIIAMRELVEIAEIGFSHNLKAGRPPNDVWTGAIIPLFRLWVHELGRKPKISGHANEPRGVKPSRLLAFVHQSMWLLEESITEQECRTILLKLRKAPAQDICEPFSFFQALCSQ